jgi:hypothetical protein
MGQNNVSVTPVPGGHTFRLNNSMAAVDSGPYPSTERVSRVMLDGSIPFSMGSSSECYGFAPSDTNYESYSYQNAANMNYLPQQEAQQVTTAFTGQQWIPTVAQMENPSSSAFEENSSRVAPSATPYLESSATNSDNIPGFPGMNPLTSLLQSQVSDRTLPSPKQLQTMVTEPPIQSSNSLGLDELKNRLMWHERGEQVSSSSITLPYHGKNGTRASNARATGLEPDEQNSSYNYAPILVDSGSLPCDSGTITTSSIPSNDESTTYSNVGNRSYTYSFPDSKTLSQSAQEGTLISGQPYRHLAYQDPHSKSSKYDNQGESTSRKGYKMMRSSLSSTIGRSFR